MDKPDMHSSSVLNEPRTRKVLSNDTDASQNLRSSIHILNDFCADTQTFSYPALAALKLKGLTLQVNAPLQELTINVALEQDYQALLWHLTPGKRTYQLLGIHFKRVHLVLELPDTTAVPKTITRTISLEVVSDNTDLRDANALGSRLRRAINVALQGHIGVLKLRDESDIENLKMLWERGRVEQLLEKYGIVPFDDSSGKLIKLWKPRRLEEGESIAIIID